MHAPLLQKLQAMKMPKGTFEEYHAEIDQYNATALQVVSLLGLAICVVLLVLSLPFVNVLHMLSSYAALTALFLVVVLLAQFVFPRRPRLAVPTYYLLLALLIGMGIAMGTVLDPTTNATTVLMLVLVLPLFIIDRPWRMNLFLLVMGLVFVAAACSFKSGRILSLDLANAAVAFIIAVLLTSFNFRVKINNFCLLRKEKRSTIDAQRSRALLELAIKSANMKVWRFDCTRTTDAEQGRQQTDELPWRVPDSLLGGGFMQQESAQAFRAMQQRMLDTGKAVNGDFRMRNPETGGGRWKHIILTPLRNEQGSLTKAVAVALDVTDRKIVEHLGSHEFEALGVIDVATGDYLLEGATDPALLSLPERMPGFANLREYVVTQRVEEDERQAVREALQLDRLCQQLDAEGLVAFAYTSSVPGTRETDDSTTLRRKKVQLQYLDQDKTSILFTWSDITALHRQEQEQMRNLKEALVQAQQATQAKTDFLSRMSHDIRTPLNAILGTTSLAMDEAGNSPQTQEYLETINSSGHFLLGLINDILDISKIESGRIELRPQVVLVSDFAASIQASIQPLMDKRRINFTTKMECGLRAIYIDRLRHHQIFFNLLSNAAKYTPEGGDVEFMTTRIPAPDGMVGVRSFVTDNGIGMTQEYLANLFEPFTRDNNVAINQTEGSGLGLAIVKNIVSEMGGTISVSSQLGKGTQFVVDLFTPAISQEVDADAQAAPQSIDLLRDKRILLVEDNDVNLMIATKLLQKQGCQVSVARNGQEAVQAFEASEPGSIALILMDIRMPVMNGLDASREIRHLNREDAETVPIIAMTADAFSDDVMKTQDAGMDGHVPKPVEQKQLYDTMLRFLAKRA